MLPNLMYSLQCLVNNNMTFYCLYSIVSIPYASHNDDNYTGFNCDNYF